MKIFLYLTGDVQKKNILHYIWLPTFVTGSKLNWTEWLIWYDVP